MYRHHRSISNQTSLEVSILVKSSLLWIKSSNCSQNCCQVSHHPLNLTSSSLDSPAFVRLNDTRMFAQIPTPQQDLEGALRLCCSRCSVAPSNLSISLNTCASAVLRALLKAASYSLTRHPTCAGRTLHFLTKCSISSNLPGNGIHIPLLLRCPSFFLGFSTRILILCCWDGSCRVSNLGLIHSLKIPQGGELFPNMFVMSKPRTHCLRLPSILPLQSQLSSSFLF